MRSNRASRLLIVILAGAGMCVSQTNSGSQSAAPATNSSVPSTRPPAPANAPDREDIVQFLNQTITWYRQLEEQRRLATEPADALIVVDNHRLAQQAIENAFAYARAQAETIAKQNTSTGDQTAQGTRLSQLAARLDAQVKELQGEIQT